MKKLLVGLHPLFSNGCLGNVFFEVILSGTSSELRLCKAMVKLKIHHRSYDKRL